MRYFVLFFLGFLLINNASALASLEEEIDSALSNSPAYMSFPSRIDCVDRECTIVEEGLNQTYWKISYRAAGAVDGAFKPAFVYYRSITDRVDVVYMPVTGGGASSFIYIRNALGFEHYKPALEVENSGWTSFGGDDYNCSFSGTCLFYDPVG